MQRLEKRVRGIWENCLSVTSSDYLIFLETLPAGCYVKSYEWAQSNPRPSMDIANSKIVFSASGLVWNILIYNSSNSPLYMLYCCEGSGNDGLNQTVHNGYANNYTTHFLINSAGKWKKVYRDNIYRYGYSTKTGLSILNERVTNETFTTNISGWSNTSNAIIARETTRFANGGLQITKTTSNSTTDCAYQSITAPHLFRYVFKSDMYSNASLGSLTYLDGHIVIYNTNPGSGGLQLGIGSVGPRTDIGLTATSYINDFANKTTTYVTLSYNNTANQGAIAFDNISVKVYEDAIKIPTLMTDRTKDCFGNTKTN